MRLRGNGSFSIVQISDNNRDVDIPNNENSDKTIQKKSLPDLDKYWKAVNDDPSDFTAWTYLLQYVEQEVINSIRERCEIIQRSK